MKSRITIEVDFENGNMPVIQILQASSDDVRDKLIKSFTECLGGSSWCQIRWHSGFSPASPVNDETGQRIFVSPIPVSKLKEHADIMMEQHRVNEEWRKGKTEEKSVSQQMKEIWQP